MYFFPKSPQFFILLENLAQKVKLGGGILSEIKIRKKELSAPTKKALRLEHQADKICHLLYQEADKAFITPIEREDIHQLAQNLDNIIDLLENLVSNLRLYQINKEVEKFPEFLKIIRKTTGKIFSLVSLLKYRSKFIPQMKKLIVQIHTQENKGDKLMRQALKSLFANHKDPVFLLQWKDLLENLEKILDECEKTADITQEIIIKNF